MPLVLHNWYSVEEAVSTFAPYDHKESFLEGQFVILPAVVLCFITCGQTTEESHVVSPSEIRWRPHPESRSKEVNNFDWIPEQVCNVWVRNSKPIYKSHAHHIFLRTPADHSYFYAGEAHLGSYGGFAANFSLHQKLPRDIWLKFGGYAGWLVEVNDQPYQVTGNDLELFKQLTNSLVSSKFSHLRITRYEEDSLTIYMNSARSFLMYLRFLGDSGLYPRELDNIDDPDAMEFFRCECGTELEFRAKQTITKELSLRIAYVFFQSGQLPEWVVWERE